jgi:hypothetical protein
VQSLAFGWLDLPIPQHGVRGRRHVDCKGRMMMRPSDLHLAEGLPLSAFRNPHSPNSSVSQLFPQVPDIRHQTSGILRTSASSITENS